MKSFNVGSGRTCLNCNVNKIGSDYDITITGGEAHIGCVALVNNGVYSLLIVDGHKEDEIIQPLAKRLCNFKDLTFIIKAGVHLENITINEIDLVLDNNKKIIDILVDYFNVL